MADLPKDGAYTVVELARIAYEPADINVRGDQVLDLLGTLVNYEAAAIHLVDPGRRAMTPLVSRGYDVPTSEHMRGQLFARETELASTGRGRRPLLFPTFPTGKLRTWTDFLEPAGLQGGVWATLFYPGGRRLGLLTVHTKTPDELTEATCDLLELLTPAVSNAVDPMRSVAAVAHLVDGAFAGVVMTRDVDLLQLPGLPTHRLVEPDSAVLAAIGRRLFEGETYMSFLSPAPDDGGPSPYLRITALACAPEPFRPPVTVVVVSTPGHLRGLTDRELEILGFLVEGWPNNRIASGLFITERTVAAHVEHILAKLGAANRTLAAVQAMRDGLYVPCDLATAQSGGVLCVPQHQKG
jgi:DNA-binding CsgD family transcriptional regulator